MNALYVSHTGLSEPLGQSQIVPYLRGLGRAGWVIDVVAFEPSSAGDDRIAAITDELARDGITYRWTRRSSSHAVAVKVAEAGRAFAALVARAMRRRPRIVHARSYLPAAVARAVRLVVPGARFIFDCRGLLGDEYVDFGHWQRESLRYRLLKGAERHLFARADAIVTLTDRLRRWLVDETAIVARDTPVAVIPCCVDLDRFRIDSEQRRATRALLAAGDRFVLAYAGNLGAWYCEDRMARLFAELRRRGPALFLVLSRMAADRLRATLHALGIADEDVAVRSVDPADMPRWLAGADAAVSFAEPRFSKIASSPVKVPEYLAVGLPVVLNRGVGDQDALLAAHPVLVDGGSMSDDDLANAAAQLVARTPRALSADARELAAQHFSLAAGVDRYLRLYERLR
jgi:glycosyltransferase involved in cell wall biosynthesis